MLESWFDAIIWYVFEGAQRQISLFLFSIIIQTIQLFDHFHEKLHEVLSSSKLESCLTVQKPGAQPGTQYFQGSSRQQLEKCLVYSIFYVFHLGTSLGKGAVSPNWYQDETHRILRKVQRGSLSSPWYLPPRLLRHQESLLLPTRYVQFLLDHYIVYIAKRLVVFATKFAEKSPFLNARLARGVLSAVSFSCQTSTTMAICAYGKDCLLF
jgi:hypothetical protein